MAKIGNNFINTNYVCSWLLQVDYVGVHFGHQLVYLIQKLCQNTNINQYLTILL